MLVAIHLSLQPRVRQTKVISPYFWRKIGDPDHLYPKWNKMVHWNLWEENIRSFKLSTQFCLTLLSFLPTIFVMYIIYYYSLHVYHLNKLVYIHYSCMPRNSSLPVMADQKFRNHRSRYVIRTHACHGLKHWVKL